MRRHFLVAAVACLALVATAVPASARTTSVTTLRDVLEQCRKARTDLVVDLADGRQLSGRVGRTSRTLFYLVDSATTREESIAYRDVRALADPATGQQFALAQATSPTTPAPGTHVPWPVWLAIIAAAVVIVVIVALK